MRYLWFLFSLILIACATPYQRSGFRGGYSEEEVGNGQYIIRFRGNAYTSSFTIERYAYRRAEEFCKEKGFQNYKPITGQNSVRQFTTPDSYSCNGSTYGNSYNGTCTHNGGTTYSKPITEILIECVQPIDNQNSSTPS